MSAGSSSRVHGHPQFCRDECGAGDDRARVSAVTRYLWERRDLTPAQLMAGIARMLQLVKVEAQPQYFQSPGEPAEPDQAGPGPLRRRRGCRGCGKKATAIGRGISRLLSEKIRRARPDEATRAKLEICKVCEHHTWLNLAHWGRELTRVGRRLPINHERHQGQGLYCAICECYLEAKVRSGEPCPQGRWSLGDRVSVIIPARNERYILPTVEGLLAQARGPVDIWVLADGYAREPGKRVTEADLDVFEEQLGGLRALALSDSRVNLVESEQPVGQRVGINELMRRAGGKYMFKLDAHCQVSPGYDRALAAACGDDDWVIPATRSLDPVTWEAGDRDFGWVYLDSDLQVNWWRRPPWADQVGPIAETMAFIGLAWFCRADLWRRLGGYDERLAHWGESGTELTAKAWLCNPTGRMLLHRGVTVAHWFRRHESWPYRPMAQAIELTKRRLRSEIWSGTYPGQVHRVEWLAGRFWPVPTWDRSNWSEEERADLRKNKPPPTTAVAS